MESGLIESRWKVGKETIADNIVTAVKTEYRLFDCAQDHNRNEKVIQQQILLTNQECRERIRRAIGARLRSSNSRRTLHYDEDLEHFPYQTSCSRFHQAFYIIEDWGLDYFNLVQISSPSNTLILKDVIHLVGRTTEP